MTALIGLFIFIGALIAVPRLIPLMIATVLWGIVLAGMAFVATPLLLAIGGIAAL